MLRNSRSTDRLLAVLLALGAFFLYVRTLAPGVLDGDSGEWQYMANILGVAHSTGYPLYLLLAKIFTLLPFGNPAWRVNLFSAACAALAVPILYLLARRVSNSRIGSLLAASLLAVAPTLWASAVEAEVYALNTLLITVLLFLAVRWYHDHHTRDLYWMALVFGLALDNHRVALFLAPGLLLLVWFQRQWLDRRDLAFAALLAIAPLLLYAYIPLRASQLIAQQSPENWQLYQRADAMLKGTVSAYYNPSLAGFLNLVTAFDNRNKLGFQDTGGDALAVRLANDARLLLQQFNPLALLLALAGAVLLYRRRRELALPLFLCALGIGAIALVLHARSTVFYFSGAYLVLALCLAVAVGEILHRLRMQPRLRAAAIALLALMPLAALWLNFPGIDESGFKTYDNYAREILRENPAQNAVVIAPWEIATPLRYYQFVEGQRRDLLIIHESPVRPQFQKIMDSAHALHRPFYYIQFTPEDMNAPGPRTVQAIGLPLLTRPQPRYPLDAPLTPEVRVVGYDLGPDPAQPGEFARVAVYYEVLAHPSSQFSAELDLTDIRGEPHGDWEHMPVSAYYPTYLWQPGEYYRDIWDVPLPADAPRGLYTFQLLWYPFDPLTNTTDYNQARTLNFGPVRVGDFASSGAPQAQRTDFANGMALLGYDLGAGDAPAKDSTSLTLRPGQTLNVALFWQAARPISGAYTVFVHLVDANGVVRAQSDRPPWAGMYPTDRWTVGETVRDDYVLPLPAALPAGQYQLQVGLYLTPDRRVAVAAGGDEVSLDTKLKISEP